MIRQLDAQQISDHWFEIAPAIDAALPPFAEGFGKDGRLNNILRALLSDQMQCWSAWGVQEGQPVLIAVFTTSFDFDLCSGVKNLLIYSLYGVQAIADEIYAEGLRSLKIFAHNHGCHRIVTFSDNERVTAIWKELGGDTQYRFLTVGV